MPSCVVKWCRNHKSYKLKCHGISFHIFPKDSVKRELWIKAVRWERGESDWTPSNQSFVCSMHFDEEEIYKSRKGMFMLKKTAVPVCTMVRSTIRSVETNEISNIRNSFNDHEGQVAKAMVNQEDFIDAKKSASTRGPRIRKRFPCTCPCCKDGVKLFFDGQRKHLCHYPDCGRVFIKKNHLVVHLRSHSGEKPYTCNFKLCGKRFSRSDELSRHKRIHSGEKIHKCPECPKSFTRSDHLTKHIRIHATKPEELEEPEIIYIKSEPKNEENDIFIMEEDRLE